MFALHGAPVGSYGVCFSLSGEGAACNAQSLA